jgi:hypothetical protein
MTINTTSDILVLIDVDTYWKRQITNSSAGSLVDPIDATTTELHLSLGSYTDVQPGQAILLGNEEMIVQTAVNPHDEVSYSTVTVTRGPNQTTPHGPVEFPRATPGAHAAGAIVKVLAYASPYELMVEKYLRPGMHSIVQELGPASACLGAVTTGSVTINP